MSGTVYVEGLALWSGRLPGWEIARTVLRGEADAPATPVKRPAPAVLAPTERRRAPDTVAIALEVAGAACASAGRDPRELPSVFASTHGDLAISDYMCSTLAATPTLISPIRFHNSVHNAAAGYWTIGTGCTAAYTAVSAHEHTFGMAMVDAIAQAVADDTPVLVVAYDIEAQGPLATVVESRTALGLALVIAPRRTERTRFVLDWTMIDGAANGPRERGGGARIATASIALDPLAAALVPGSPLAAALPLFRAFATGAATPSVHTAGTKVSLRLVPSPVAALREEVSECTLATT
jgi:hypothetical protein